VLPSESGLRERTIKDFGEQWSRYPNNDGWYGSVELLHDMLEPLLSVAELSNAIVAEIGSGSGRIVGMLLKAGVRHVHAIEPSEAACDALRRNLQKLDRPGDVTIITARGDEWRTDISLDYVLSIGVIHHIPDPSSAIRAAYDALKPGGRLFVWVYGHEGNNGYLAVRSMLRRVTTRLPHVCLTIVVWILYAALAAYRFLAALLPLPLRGYIENVLWPMTPANRRLVIYDQLNPAYAKYYRQHEVRALLEDQGFIHVILHNRHGYSWSVIGEKPL